MKGTLMRESEKLTTENQKAAQEGRHQWGNGGRYEPTLTPQPSLAKARSGLRPPILNTLPKHPIRQTKSHIVTKTKQTLLQNRTTPALTNLEKKQHHVT